MAIPYVQTKSSITVYVDGKAYPISKDHLNFQRILSFCQDTSSTVDSIRELVDVKTSLSVITRGKITINSDDKEVCYEGRKLHNALTTRILSILKEGGDIQIFINFMENLMLSPSYRAVEELYGFLDTCSLPLTSDGCFLAYKKVRFDYKDIHSGTMDNGLGKTVTMKRNEVDEDSRRTCSAGLHCASFGYLSHYGSSDKDDRIVIVKVNPKDVVAVPADYDNQKMRVCEYVVIDEIPNDGITTLIDWCYGKKDVAFVRDTLTWLKNFAQTTFELDQPPAYDTQLWTHEVSEVDRISFLEAILTNYKLKTTVDSFVTKYDKQVTLKNTLQWISNWS